jgi:hypothetical protein
MNAGTSLSFLCMERNRMNQDQVAQARDKDLPSSLIAIRRAAQAARDTAMRTGTAIVVWRNGQVVRISASELRQTESK